MRQHNRLPQAAASNAPIVNGPYVYVAWKSLYKSGVLILISRDWVNNKTGQFKDVFYFFK